MYRSIVAGALALVSTAALAQPAQDPPAAAAPPAASYGAPKEAGWQPVHPQSAPVDYKSLQQAAKQSNRRGAQGVSATANASGRGARTGGRRRRGG